MHINGNKPNAEALADALRIWNYAAISLLDIRHNLISPEEAVRGYRMPASTFLYTSGGKAEVSLNDTSYNVERFGLFHGGKGTELSIQPRCGWLEYYMVLYKAGEPPFYKRELSRLLERTNPFRHQYGFVPANPVFFSEQLRKMYEKWQGPTPLNLFYGKTAFYQLVYEIYEELDKGRIPVLQPDIAAMAKRYIDESYMQTVNIQAMADALSVSYSHLHRVFKQQTGNSPQEYLLDTRLNSCKFWLAQSGLSMREIAQGNGFSDEYHFNRMFVRHVGMTPGEYRKKMTMDMRDYAIGNILPFPYNEESRVRLGKLKGEGAYSMFKQMSGKAVMAAALSLMLLMSACGTTPANTGGAESSPSSAVTTQVSGTEATEPVEEGTRTISTVMGDVEVPVNPKRVACHTWAGDLLSLGITPVISNDAKLGAMEDALAGTEMSQFEEPEEIMAADPDLIIIRNKDRYGDYSKIAPTLVVEYDTSVDERMKFFGEVFGIEEKAQEVLDAFYAKVESYIQDFKDAGIYGKSIVIFSYNPENANTFIFGDDYGYGAQILYNLLDFNVPEIVQKEIVDTGDGFKQLSWEVISDYLNADIIQFISFKESDLDELSNNALWNSVEAVQKGNVIQYSYDYDRKSLYVMDKMLDHYHEQFMLLAK